MRVCIDARIPDVRNGGVQQLIAGLAVGLASLDDGDEEYVFVAYHGREAWLRPVIGGKCRIQTVTVPQTSVSRLRGRLGNFPLLSAMLREIYHAWRVTLSVLRRIHPQQSTGTFERLAADVVHFPLQAAELVSLPNIYHPHDLQHVHFPQYFTAYERRARQTLYSAYVRNATAIAVASSWVKQDLIANLNCPVEKIYIVPLAPPNTYQDYQEAALAPLPLPDEFFFYPAQTWPHKNHAVLIEALARLHSLDDARPHLVFTGTPNAYRYELEQRASRLGLAPYVHFLGFITPAQLSFVYGRCIGCIIPSLFEAASFPAWEAFFAGVPVAYANITSLPAQIGDAGLSFDPHNSEDLCHVLQRLYRDGELRAALVDKGRARVAELSWRRTALHFRALYRLISGGRGVTTEDRAILSAPPAM